MATFDPQTLQTSSLRGESFIEAPVQRVSPQAVGAALEGGAKVYGSYVANRAQRDVQAAQNTFLDELEANRTDKEAIEEQRELQEASPADRAIYERTSQKIRTLEQSIESRQINPTEAMARIEDIKRRAINQAPFMASRIKGLSGNRGAVFDAETEQLISEVNRSRNGMLDMGLDPDNPRHRDMYTQMLATQEEAKFIANNKEVYGYRAGPVARKLVGQVLTVQEDTFKNTIAKHGGLENASPRVRSELLESVMQYKNNAPRIVSQIIDSNPNLSYDDIPPETIKLLEAQVIGLATAYEKVFDGSLPTTAAANQLSLAQDNEMLKFSNEDPYGFMLMSMLSNFPQGSVISRDLGEKASRALNVYAISFKKNGANATDDMLNQGYTLDDVKAAKSAYADNITAAANWFKSNPQGKTDPKLVNAFYQRLDSDLNGMALKPNSFTQKEHSAHLNVLASPELSDMIKTVDAVTHKQFTDSAVAYLGKYTQEHLAPSISKDTIKGFSLPMVSGQPQLDQPILPTITSTGALQFKVSDKITDSVQRGLAEQQAAQLTAKYSQPITQLLLATENTLQINNPAARKDLMIRLLGDAMNQAGTPLLEVSKD